MRILHAPHNIGGMAGVLAAAQRALGHQATSYAFAPTGFGYSADVTMNDHCSAPERWQKALQLALRHDIFHFYFGNSLLGESLTDVPILARLGKKTFFYFCGCDIRDEKATIMKYPVNGCRGCFPKRCSPNRDMALACARRYGRVNFVSTPDLMEFVERSVLLPQAVDFECIDTLLAEPPPEKVPGTFIIAHAPTSRAVKGTAHLQRAVEELKGEGIPAELLLLENLSHRETLRACRKADLGVDQLLIGSYGLFAAELMALGVPALAYIREDLAEKYPEKPPLLSADPAAVTAKLMEFYENRDAHHDMKEAGIAYARKYHDPLKLARQCLEYYQT